jgi:hypothetical protein
MAVVAADLIYPVGVVQAAWFAGEDVAANLTLWIADGVATAPVGATEPQTDAIAAAWAYYRAFQSKADQIAAKPSNVQITGALGVAQGDGRHKYFSTRAASWLAEYEAALAAAEPAPETPTFTGYARGTHVVERAVSW